jgi:CRP/FNR family transcriptional regulator
MSTSSPTPVAALASYPPFSRLGTAAREQLDAGMVSRHCASTTPLLFKGQVVSGAYFVLTGRLRVYSIAPNGAEATLYFITPGETCVFALNSLFNELRYPAWVQAVEDSTIALIPGPLYRQLFAGEPVVRDLTVHALSTLVFRLMDTLAEVHACTLGQRLINVLLVQANAAGELRMTQQQLADHLGTTREVVARLLGQLVSAGLVQTRRGATHLLDPAALRQRLLTP